MFISPAFAQDGGGLGGIEPLIPLVLIFVVFWFFLIRPQQKKMKDHREMVAALRRGDQVVTGGGLIGRVTKVIDDNTCQVELTEGVRVKVVRSTITDVLSRGEPVKGAKSGGGGGGGGDSKTEAPAEKKSLFSFGQKK